MARAIWKGVLDIAGERVPVKLYSAVQDRSVRFRLLQEKQEEPLKQQMVDPETEEPVAYSEIRRAYQTDDGRFVVLDAEELEELQPEPSRDIEITRFVPEAAIDHRWYERPYYLGPDGDDEAYVALLAALADTGREGVARWTMRKKAYVGALRIERNALALITLRNAGEVIAASSLTAPKGRDLDKRELKMAQQLVEALADEFRPEDYQDEYRARVLELIEKKRRGQKVRINKPKTRKPTETSLADMLEKSLKQAKRKRAA